MYTFPGIEPFVRATAARTGRDLHQIGRANEIWHCKQIQDALGQLPRLDPKSQAEALARVRHHREGLALALEGVDAAIADVVTAIKLDPEILPDENSKPARQKRA